MKHFHLSIKKIQADQHLILEKVDRIGRFTEWIQEEMVQQRGRLNQVCK